MRRKVRVAAAAIGAAVIVMFSLSTALAAVAPRASVDCSTSVTHVIGVDNQVPAGHNWTYTDYFPRGLPTGSGVVAHPGDCVEFRGANTPNVDNGFHTATLLMTTESLPSTNPWADTPFAVPDSDGGETGLQINPKAFFPSDPTCGTANNAACAFDGTSRANSGAPLGGPLDFFVQLNVQPATYTFVCYIHPGMFGTLNVEALPAPGVVPRVVTLPPENTNATSTAQYNADTTEATAAETAANNSAVTTNSDGSHTVTVVAGTGTAHTEILEMLPQNASVTAGDTVKWNTDTPKEIHTVTFPNGSGSNSVDPIAQPPACEANPVSGPDTPSTPGPPPFGCVAGPDPTTLFPFELPFVAGPSGPTSISSTSTVATSGIIAGPASPFPQTYSFKFPNTGTFPYQCRIHDHMIGAVSAAAFIVPVLPAAGARSPVLPVPTGSGSSGAGIMLLATLTLSGLMVGRGLMFLRRRQA